MVEIWRNDISRRTTPRVNVNKNISNNISNTNITTTNTNTNTNTNTTAATTATANTYKSTTATSVPIYGSSSSSSLPSQPYNHLLHMNNSTINNSNGNPTNQQQRQLRLDQLHQFQQRQRQQILLRRQNNNQSNLQTYQQTLQQHHQQIHHNSLGRSSVPNTSSVNYNGNNSFSSLRGSNNNQENQPRRLSNMPASVTNPLAAYKSRKDQERLRVLTKYDIVGYIAAGTYGRVYKANSKNLKENRVCAIKKFKADKEGEITHYTGISQSACREMALCRELNHKNITKLVEIILEDKSIYMVFDFAEHDLLQIIHFHCHPERRPIPESTVKSVLWQLLNGVSYLHQNWVVHRDLKPANIMLTTDGVVKIGDLGLARLFKEPLQSLWAGDKVVVTIWYRAPELLFGARHYTPAIDLWAVGCVFAELLSLRPIFKGEEAKMDNKRNVPFQRNQVQKVVEILGTPTVEKWPALAKYPEYHSLQSMKSYAPNLESWYHSTGWTNMKGFELLSDLLEYDPSKRITANDALLHPYFTEAPRVSQNVFEGQHFEYPSRRISSEDNDIKASSYPGTKRTAIDDSTQARKKQK